MRHDEEFVRGDDAVIGAQRGRPIEFVREGMEVVDLSGEKIGTVKDLRIGDPDDVSLAGGPDQPQSLIGSLAEAFGNEADPDVPAGLRERYLRRGYLKVDPGLIGSDRYVLSDDIVSVRGDTVRLAVDRDQVIDERVDD
jgi:hypothetical protein